MDSSDSGGDSSDDEDEDQALSKHGKALTKQVEGNVNAGRPLVVSLRMVCPPCSYHGACMCDGPTTVYCSNSRDCTFPFVPQTSAQLQSEHF